MEQTGSVPALFKEKQSADGGIRTADYSGDCSNCATTPCKVDMKLVPCRFSLSLPFPSHISMLLLARSPMSKINVYILS